MSSVRSVGRWKVQRVVTNGSSLRPGRSYGLAFKHLDDGRLVAIELVGATPTEAERFFENVTLEQIEEAARR